MIFVRIIDNNGFFVEDAFVESLTDVDGNPISTYIETPCPDGFYLPRWNDTQWVEGKTAEEIAAIKSNAVIEKTAEQRIDELETLVLQMGGII